MKHELREMVVTAGQYDSPVYLRCGCGWESHEFSSVASHRDEYRRIIRIEHLLDVILNKLGEK